MDLQSSFTNSNQVQPVSAYKTTASPATHRASLTITESFLDQLIHKSRSHYYLNPSTYKLALIRAQRYPSAKNLTALAELEIEQELYPSAISLLDAALLQRPEEAGILFRIHKALGNAYLFLQDLDSAEEHYHKAFGIRPTSSTILVNLGTLNVQRKNWLLVDYYFKEALKYRGDHDKAWVGLAIYHDYLGDRELAIGNLKRALDENPGNRTAIIMFSAWAGPNDSSAVIQALKNYLVIHPFDQDMSLVLIQKATENQDFNVVELELEKLLCLEPQNPVYHQLYKELQEVQNAEQKATDSSFGKVALSPK